MRALPFRDAPIRTCLTPETGNPFLEQELTQRMESPPVAGVAAGQAAINGHHFSEGSKLPARTRVYLAVPPAEGDEAKQLGARWSPERRQWWVERRHLADNPGLHKWVLDGTAITPRSALDFTPPTARGRAWLEDLERPVTTKQRTFLLPVCTCSTPPWEHCEHTLTQS